MNDVTAAFRALAAFRDAGNLGYDIYRGIEIGILCCGALGFTSYAPCMNAPRKYVRYTRLPSRKNTLWLCYSSTPKSASKLSVMVHRPLLRRYDRRYTHRYVFPKNSVVCN